MASKSQVFEKIKSGHVPGKWDDLEAIFDELEMTPVWAMTILKTIADDQSAKERDRLKAIDLWAKLAGYKPPERVFVSSNEYDIGFAKAEESE